MNPLEALKQKLMVKPTVEERERVAVVIKGEKKPRKLNIAKEKTATKKGKKSEDSDDNEENQENQENQESEEEESLNLKPGYLTRKPENQNETVPIIVDETNKGFDRMTLLKKLKESKMNKVTVKEGIEKMQQQKEPEPTRPLITPIKKAKKISVVKPLIIEDEEVEEGEEGKKADDQSSEEFVMKPKKKVVFVEKEQPNEKEEEVLQVKVPKKKQRITKKPEKGIAMLGPETIAKIGDAELIQRIPKKSPPILIKVSNYYMNNREIFINFINSLFEPYRIEMQNDTEGISCDNIGKTSTDFSLLTHQKIVRDYMNLYTPYRGLLLYHGLGSGKTCTSIAIAEGMKESKCVIIMTPASLQANYREELKKCGDLLYKRNQYWEWINTTDHPEALDPISAILNLPREFIQRHGGAWFVNVKKKSNYDDLNDEQKKTLEEQLNEMIKQKYRFINYNGLRSQRLHDMTSGYTKNIFDNSVVIIDEAHNFISRIVNKLKKEKPASSEEKKAKKKEETKEETKEDIFEDDIPLNLATKLYYMLLRAKNARIVLLSGTPVINYPNEFAILFNILRGYIKTWKIPLNVKTSKKIDKNSIQDILMGVKALDYLDYSPQSKMLTITKNPFGFKNKVGRESGYLGVQTNFVDNSNYNPVVNDTKENKKKAECKNEQLKVLNDSEYIFSDDEFIKKIISTLRRDEIEVLPEGITVKNMKALPDTLDLFEGQYIDFETKKIKNIDSLKRRILGLSSYFRSAQENLLPRYNKELGVDYHIIRIPMSDFQFKIYESARKEERKSEKVKPKQSMADLLKESTSTYRIFSRLFCNFVMPERPIPERKSKKEGEATEADDMDDVLKDAEKNLSKQDVTNEQEGEIEGDEILDEIGGLDYKVRLDRAIQHIVDNSNDFLTPQALQTYSPKFLNILENIIDPDYLGLHLVYSQFRTAEGIGLFCKVLDKNGFARFRIKKNASGIWETDIRAADAGKQTYALYTGTETTEEKEIVRHIYNGEWNEIPDSIGNELKKKYRNNNMGEVVKVFMITSSGSEGINLRNTRYVHIMEPYWHPVRSEQVIGRARRICSHKDLPKPFQTVEVFVYLMTFTPEQLKSDEAIELKRKDLSKALPKAPQTSDQYLFEISEIKYNLTAQLTDAIKQSSFDCYIYSNGKCVNFGDATNDKFSYVPDYSQQQNDTTVRANQKTINWTGKPIELYGVKYVYRRMAENLLNIYDLASYEAALEDPTVNVLQIGTLYTNERGEKIFDQLVT